MLLLLLLLLSHVMTFMLYLHQTQHYFQYSLQHYCIIDRVCINIVSIDYASISSRWMNIALGGCVHNKNFIYTQRIYDDTETSMNAHHLIFQLQYRLVCIFSFAKLKFYLLSRDFRWKNDDDAHPLLLSVCCGYIYYPIYSRFIAQQNNNGSNCLQTNYTIVLNTRIQKRSENLYNFFMCTFTFRLKSKHHFCKRGEYV